ncbi:MAG: hypothetical protein ACO3GP_05305 [Candidatus Limnocylindrus sp.]
MSWDDLETPDNDIRGNTQARDDLDRLILRIFTSEDGANLLDWLRQVYVDVPVAAPGTDPSFAYFAEGQRNVVRDFIARIQRARKL